MLRILHGIVMATIESKIVWETKFAGQTLTNLVKESVGPSHTYGMRIMRLYYKRLYRFLDNKR